MKSNVKQLLLYLNMYLSQLVWYLIDRFFNFLTEIIEALHHNDSTKDWNSLTNGKTDLIAWLCVGGLLMLASVCAFIVFRKQYGSCSGKLY